MSKSIRRKGLSILLTLTMIVSLFAGLTISASATGGAYAVTFNSTNASAKIGHTTYATGSSADSDSSGNLEFKIVPSIGYRVSTVTTNNSNVTVSYVKTNSYKLSGVDAATTVTVTTAACPTDYWTSESSYYDTTWYTTNTAASSFSVTDAADLAGLAYLVNSGTTTFAGKTITLSGTGIDLSAHMWYPIGGVAALSSGVPSTTHYFSGTFDGGNVPIKGMYIPYISGASGYGLFGYVNGGALVNITLDSNDNASTSNELNVGTNSVSGLGSIVGYTNGDVYNCHSDCWVYMANTSASMCGGIVGTAENIDTTSATTLYVQFCSNTGDLTGRGRLGGIVGAAYTSYTGGGGLVIDNCCNKADLTTVGTSTKSYTGGIVGYCRGYITNCYSYGCHIETNGGHYQAGIAGLIQGSSPMGGMSNCYAYSTFGTNANVNYDRWLFGTVDSSTTMTLANSLWVDTNQLGLTTKAITQPDGTSTANWGNWTRVGYYASGSGTYDYTSKTLASTYTTSTAARTDNQDAMTAVLNSTSDLLSSSRTSSAAYTCRAKLANAFEQDSTHASLNGGYPYLAWEVSKALIPTYSGSSASPVVGESVVYVNGTSGSDSYNGTSSDTPFLTLSKAISSVANGGTIYVTGTVTLTSDTSCYKNVTIARSGTFTGQMFNITGGTTIMSGVTLEGAGSASTTDTVFAVNASAAALQLRGGTVVKNTGTAVDLNSGSLEVTGASITANTYSIDVASGTTFNFKPLSSTSISGTVYLASGAYITVNSALTSTVTILCANPTSGTTVASASTIAVANSCVSNFSYSGGSHTFVRSGMAVNLV